MVNYAQNLKINRAILHKIHERKIDKTIKDPEYSSKLAEINVAGMNALRNRIVNAIGNNSCSLEMEICNVDAGTTFDLAQKSINESDDVFIENSKKIAYNLAEAQKSRRLPSGTVVVFEGTTSINSYPYIGIIKAEPQEGFKFEGQLLDFIENLILTKHQKFYKIGMFIKVNDCKDNESDNFVAIVYDSNLAKITSDAASYFYNDFLGCEKLQSEPNLNKQFYLETRDFIDSIEDIRDDEKLDLNYALYSYMEVEKSGTISVNDFSDKYLDKKIESKYKNHMKNKSFPLRNIGKDTSIINNLLKNRKINFTNDIQLVAPSESFKEMIEFKNEEDKTIVIINGSIVKQN